MPDYQKAKGIGDSVDAYLAPGTYHRDGGKHSEIKAKVETQIRKKVAVKDWHKRMQDEDQKQSPLVTPGPG